MRLVSWMLRLFPRRFREQYGDEIRRAHVDRLEDRGDGRAGIGFWIGTVWDLLAAAIFERVGGRGSAGSAYGDTAERGGRGWTRELREAVRALRRRPGYATMAVLTLGLGIGGVAAMVSVTNDVLLEPLPYERDDEIVVLWNNGQTARPTFDTRWRVSQDQVQAFQRTATTVASSTWISSRTDATLETDGRLELVPTALASGNVFEFFGARAAVGRLFTSDDAAEALPVAVISHHAWQRRFGADPSAIGRSVMLHGRPRTVIGVLPPEFRWFLRDDGERAEFWIPEDRDDPTPFYAYALLARPAAGSSMEAVRMEFAPVAWDMFTNPGYKNTFTVSDAATADHLRTYVLGDVSAGVPILLLAVGLVMLLASLSVAHLVLGRVGTRESEFALRLALGGSRGRVAWLVCAETAVVVAFGTVAGVLFAQWGLGVMRAAAPAGIPRLDSVALSPTALLAVVGISAVVLGVVSVVPGWFASRVTAGSVVVHTARGVGARTARTRQLMIASQVGAAVFLLVGSSLVLRSWRALVTEDLGFQTAGVLTARFEIPTDRWEDTGLAIPSSNDKRPRPARVLRGTPRLFTDLDRLAADVAALPGVERVALARPVPLSGAYGWWTPVRIQGWEDRAWDELTHGTSANWVSAEYFDVLDIAPTRGRLLTDADGNLGAPPVAVVSESFAATFWPDEDPLGKRFYIHDGATMAPDGTPVAGMQLAEVVGVVAALREGEVQESNVTVFLPYRWPLRLNTVARRDASLLVKTTVPPAPLANQLRDVAALVFPDVPLEDVASMDAIADTWLREPTFFAYIVTLFGGYGLLLSLVGIVGVVSFQVTRRTQEVGVRMALGAQRRHIVTLFTKELGAFVVLGLTAGLGGAVVASRFIEAWLYEVGRLDPGTFVGVPILFITAAAAAAWWPARRAVRLDVVETLR